MRHLFRPHLFRLFPFFSRPRIDSHSRWLSGFSSSVQVEYSTLDPVEDYTVVEDGVFFYSPPEGREFFDAFSLYNAPIASKSAKKHYFTKQKGSVSIFSSIASREKAETTSVVLPRLRTTFSKGKLGVGTVSPEFLVSPVFEDFGGLWQWRPLTVFPSSSILGFQTSGDAVWGDSPMPEALFFMVPFLLYPGHMVETKSPVISSSARDEIYQSINALLLAQNNTSPAENEFDQKVFRLLLENSAECGDSVAGSLSLPTAIGHLKPAILREKHGRHSSFPGSKMSSYTPTEMDGTVWASSYFALLDLFVDWKESTRRSDQLLHQKNNSKKPFQSTLEEEGRASEGEAENPKSVFTSPDLSKASVGGALPSLPQQKEGESAKTYAERCWMSFVEGGAESSDSLSKPCDVPWNSHSAPKESPLPLLSSSSSSSSTTTEYMTAAHPWLPPFLSLPKPDPPPIKRIPSNFRNVIGGGLAELIISLDRYAALISRGELTVPAACWALLCDMNNPEAVLQLRSHAVMLEKEAMAAAEAHKQLTLNALMANQTLVGKSCHGDITRWVCPSRIQG